MSRPLRFGRVASALLLLLSFFSPDCAMGDPHPRMPHAAPPVEKFPPPVLQLPLPRKVEDEDRNSSEKEKKPTREGVGTVPGNLPVRRIDLATAKQLALQRQPAVLAARASLDAAHARKRGVDNLHIPLFLQRDLPIRRQQAAHGIEAATAGVLKAESDTIYSVQFTYVSYLYARAQEKLAERSLANLNRLAARVKDLAKSREKAKGNPDLSEDTTERIKAMIRFAEGKREEAIVGSQRALSAFREAIGLEPDCKLVLDRDDLLAVTVALDCQKLVELALKYRPEIRQAEVFATVCELEVQAQLARQRWPSIRTFASSSDIHAQPIPPGSYDAGYSPAALGPEMPGTLNGSQADRVLAARMQADRARQVVDKTRNLIRLEVEQAYLRTVEASRKLVKYLEGAEATERSLDAAEFLFDRDEARLRLESILNTGLVGSQITLSVNETRYQLLTGLAALERGTAGAYQTCFEKAATVQDATAKSSKDPTRDSAEKKNEPDDNKDNQDP